MSAEVRRMLDIRFPGNGRESGKQAKHVEQGEESEATNESSFRSNRGDSR
jgi:hypothetical protein